MKERPILFSGAMVRALLTGTKTQTRRVVKSARDPHIGCWMTPGEIALDSATVQEVISPYGQPGDRLWVREAWGFERRTEDDPLLEPVATYRADDAEHLFPVKRWRPSIHMPRHISRITLEVTGVRVERLQDISEADARAEGVSRAQCPDWHATTDFRAIWESINGPGSWDANPWVWVVEFKRLEAA